MLSFLRDYQRTIRDLRVPRRSLALLFSLKIAIIVAEGAGVGMLLPVVQFIQQQGDLSALTQAAPYWETVIAAFGAVGLAPSLPALMAVSFTALLVRQGLVYAERIARYRARERFIQTQRDRGFERFLYARTDFQEGVRQGEIINDLTTETERATVGVFEAVTLAGNAAMVVAYTLGLLALSTQMTLVSFVVIGVSLTALRGLLRQTASNSQRITEANRAAIVFLAERLRSTRLIRLSRMESAEVDAMRALNQDRFERSVFFNMMAARAAVVIEPLTIGLAFLLVYLGAGVFALSLDVIAIFLVVLIRLLPVVKEAFATWQTLLGFQASLIRLREALKAIDAAVEPASGSTPLTGIKTAIEVREVHFAYGGREGPALDGVSLTIPTGAIVGVVGPSGAGKSTLVDLLPALRHPQRGEILIDGRPLSTYELESLRRAVAYVPQAPEVFDVSIASHIRYGRSDADDAEMRRAAELAGAAEFIDKLPDGYDTMLGENGYAVSGGQKQRLELARALVQNASLLILDEPSSNLDAMSEELLQKALARIRDEAGKTIVVVAHRLATVTQADRIYVMNAGRVEAVGDHRTLLRENAWYRRAAASQGLDGGDRRTAVEAR